MLRPDLAVTAIVLASCGYPKLAPLGSDDAPRAADAAGDGPSIPPKPGRGAQIDRMGRPAINTALEHVFDLSGTSKGAAKDAYNQDVTPAGWSGYVNEFAKNLGVYDSVDSGLTCTSGTCMASAANGCGNQVLYNGTVAGGGSPMATSYSTLAGVLADDRLYLDTTKSACSYYLAIEFGAVTGLGNTTCGGRTPTYDVVDFSYTLLTAGIAGFDVNFTPALGDGVGVHSDVSNVAFPFLGPPHNP
jgi:hypothetical protein